MSNFRSPEAGNTVANAAACTGIMIVRGSGGVGALAVRTVNSAIFFAVVALLRALTLLTSRNVQRFLIAVILLDIPLLLDTHFGYRQDLADLGSLGGFGVSVTTLALAALYAAWIIEIVVTRHGSRPGFSISSPLAAYVLISALSMFVAKDMLLASFEVWVLFQTLLVFVYFASRVRSRDDVIFIIRVLLIGLVVESAIILSLQAGMRFDIPGHPLRIEEAAVGGEYTRFGGTLGSPNAAGGYISLLMALALSVIVAPVGRWDKRMALLAFGLGLVALVFTFSRGGWTAFVLSLAVFGFAMRKRGRMKLKTLVLFAVAILAVVSVLRGEIGTRLFADDGGIAINRVYLMQIAFQMISDYPVLGVGANNFPLLMTQYLRAGDWLYVVHNKYLLIWAEVGIGGLVAFLAFLISTIRRGWRLWQSDDQLLSLLALGLTAGIIGHTSHLLVDLFRGRQEVQLLWLMASLITALSWMDCRGGNRVRSRMADGRAGDYPNKQARKFS